MSYIFFVYEGQDLDEIFKLGFSVSSILASFPEHWRPLFDEHIWPRPDGWIRVSSEDLKMHLGQSFGPGYEPDYIPECYRDDGLYPSQVITYEDYVEMLGGKSFLSNDLEGLLW